MDDARVEGAGCQAGFVGVRKLEMGARSSCWGYDRAVVCHGMSKVFLTVSKLAKNRSYDLAGYARAVKEEELDSCAARYKQRYNENTGSKWIGGHI